jgi:para-nitrobenzyl esterase
LTSTDQPIATISAGRLRGIRQDGVDRYLGVPYAAAPIGVHRFAEPAPASAWDGIRDATRMGPTAPQNPYGEAVAPYLANVIDPGDEFLNVNVWAPADARDCPVMVWVHGGSGTHGSNAVDGYDGTAFAREGIVFVGINYRLAAEGFSVLDDAPLNLGLADVAAALRWVRAEIQAFGGDPRNVTAFGESAGAFSLARLLASPPAAQLFDRVILQSGAPGAAKRSVARRITKLTAKQLGIPTTREAFLSASPAQLLEAEATITAKSNALTGGPSYDTAVGGELVPRPPLEALLAGAGDAIPLLMGWTSEEYRLFLVPSGIIDRVGRGLFALARLRFGIAPRVLRAYRDAHPGAGRGVLLGEMLIDHLLRLPLNRMADSRLNHKAAPTYAYEFAWPSPVGGLGAAHAMEIGFVFDRLSSADWIRLTGEDAPQQLADDMHAAWVRFATTGNPGWRRWDASRPVMVFDVPSSELVEAPRDAQLAVWRRRENDRLHPKADASPPKSTDPTKGRP